MPGDLPRGEGFRHSNLGLQSRFSIKKSFGLAHLPSQGLKVTATRAAAYPQHWHTPRALHTKQPYFPKPLQPWRNQAVRPGPTHCYGWWCFLLIAWGRRLTRFLRHLFSMLRIVEPGWHEMRFWMSLLSAVILLLTQNVVLKGKNWFLSPRAEVGIRPRLQILS